MNISTINAIKELQKYDNKIFTTDVDDEGARLELVMTSGELRCYTVRPTGFEEDDYVHDICPLDHIPMTARWTEIMRPVTWYKAIDAWLHDGRAIRIMTPDGKDYRLSRRDDKLPTEFHNLSIRRLFRECDWYITDF